jgi:DivIVA domain-containing protein
MSLFQPDNASGQRTASNLPAFQLVRRGYDPGQVDAYLPQLSARLEQAERAWAELQLQLTRLRDQPPPAFQQLGAEAAMVLQEAGRSAELLVEQARRRAEAIAEQAQQQAQTVLEEANQAAERVRQQVQQERAALDSETAQVRQFRDGLLEELGRAHGDITALLERTHGHKARQPVPGAARPEADPAPEELVVAEAEPAGAVEPVQPQPVQAPTDAPSQQRAALAPEAAARRPGHVSAPARHQPRRPGPPG